MNHVTKKKVNFLIFLSMTIPLMECSQHKAGIGVYWKVTQNIDGRIIDSSSVRKDNGICHGIKISFLRLEVISNADTEYDCNKWIQEFYDGKEDGIKLYFDKNDKIY